MSALSETRGRAGFEAVPARSPTRPPTVYSGWDVGRGSGPAPRDGLFADGAARLAGFAGAALGWSPDAFWRATPAELGAVVAALTGEVAAPPDAAMVARLREAFPDG